MAVSADAHGKGIGAMLLKGFQSRADTLRIPIRLGVFRNNKPAQKLYERLEFHVSETRTHIELSWTSGHFSSNGDKS
ncbi:GNAT family N-acetyltransferase [Diaphorobacter sp. HDW4A]|nr:GNAT family N-acetyltransferase [Diaphorobacter sp. HDW4A]